MATDKWNLDTGLVFHVSMPVEAEGISPSEETKLAARKSLGHDTGSAKLEEKWFFQGDEWIWCYGYKRVKT